MNKGVLIAGTVVVVLAAAAGGPWSVARAAGPGPDEASTAPAAAGDDQVPLPIPPVPPRIAEGADYDHCLSMLNTDPAGAYAFADAWFATGGGEGAIHCKALADVQRGDADVGAEAMDKLAGSSNAPAAARAVVYGQAGQAWLMARDPGRAMASATLALSLTPDDPDLLIDRSIASANLDRYQDALDDLTRALDLDPRRPDALVFRSAAWRHLDQPDLAQDDIDRALAQDPDNPDALLERGILRQRRGEGEGAREDWERAMLLAPDTATADLAQQNLQLLEAGPDRR
jgi:tetratricopeptide (TPR) repeat protein